MFPGVITAQGQFPAEEILKTEKMDISEQDSRISEISQKKRKAGDDALNLSPKVLNPLDGELDDQRSIKKIKTKIQESTREEWDDSDGDFNLSSNLRENLLISSSSLSSSSSSSSSSSASIALAMLYAEWTFDPRPIREAVNAAIGKTVISVLVNLVVDYLKKNGSVNGFFGPEEWEKFCGKVGPAPDLPDNIENIWESQCPIFPEKRVCETHMFVYIPKTVNEKPLTIKSLGEIAKLYFPKNKEGYDYLSGFVTYELGDKSIEKSYWVLMTRDVLPDSRNKNYVAQQSMVVELAKKVQAAAYEVPRTLEAAVCILAQYFMSHDSSKTRLFSDDPWTYTRCQEEVRGDYRVLVGGFAAAGLRVLNRSSSLVHVGVAALQKFS